MEAQPGKQVHSRVRLGLILAPAEPHGIYFWVLAKSLLHTNRARHQTSGTRSFEPNDSLPSYCGLGLGIFTVDE